MIQEILSCIYEPLRLAEKVNNLEEFLELTDQSIFALIKNEFRKLLEKYDVEEEDLLEEKTEVNYVERLLIKAYRLLRRFESRNLWKLLTETSFTASGADP